MLFMKKTARIDVFRQKTVSYHKIGKNLEVDIKWVCMGSMGPLMSYEGVSGSGLDLQW